MKKQLLVLQHSYLYVRVLAMTHKLKQRLKQNADFDSPVNEALLNLLVAADVVRKRISGVCAEFGLTQGQYNVLRILRGAYPEGHPRCDIAARMLEEAPDVTRLVDRLEKQNLVERDRADDDRRLSIARITEKGLQLLAEAEPQMKEIGKFFENSLSNNEARKLTNICEKIYAEKK